MRWDEYIDARFGLVPFRLDHAARHKARTQAVMAAVERIDPDGREEWVGAQGMRIDLLA